MKTKIRFILLFLLSCLSLQAETDKVLLRIDGTEIPVDEFNYYFQRSAQKSGKTPGEYLPRFLDFKLKVADARRMCLDTLPDFRNQYEILRTSLLKTILTDEKQKRELCHSLYLQQNARLSLQDWIKMEEITILLPQHTTVNEERKARQTIDSIYIALEQGASFSELAKNYSDVLGQPSAWQPSVRLLSEVAGQLACLSAGNYSKPFYSPLGIHIVKLIDRKPCLSFDEAYPFLSRYITQTSFTTSFFKQPLYEQWLSGTIDMNTLPFRELYEGLLITYWDNRSPQTKITSPTEKDLESYFKKHKTDYRWELPHFRGAVIHCLNKKAASKIKKYLKKLPETEWEAALSQISKTHPELRAKIETGLFQIGTNCYIDKLAFKCGSFSPEQDLPHTFILGKRLKKGAEKYTDVREQVEKDYLKTLQQEKTSGLEQRFKVEINQDVLKTVNCSGNI